VGGSLGTALLNTIAVAAGAGYLAVHGTSAATLPAAAVHGYAAASGVAALFLALAGLTALLLIDAGRRQERLPMAEGRHRPAQDV